MCAPRIDNTLILLRSRALCVFWRLLYWRWVRAQRRNHAEKREFFLYAWNSRFWCCCCGGWQCVAYATSLVTAQNVYAGFIIIITIQQCTKSVLYILWKNERGAYASVKSFAQCIVLYQIWNLLKTHSIPVCYMYTENT